MGAGLTRTEGEGDRLERVALQAAPPWARAMVRPGRFRSGEVPARRDAGRRLRAGSLAVGRNGRNAARDLSCSASRRAPVAHGSPRGYGGAGPP